MIEQRRERLQEVQKIKTNNLKVLDILMVLDLKQFIEVENKNLQIIKKCNKNRQKNKENKENKENKDNKENKENKEKLVDSYYS